MAGIPRNPMKFFWWLRKLMYIWVRTKVVPDQNILTELGIDPKKPVCYLLYSKSLSDVLVLEETCNKYNLPLPHHRPTALKFPGSASFIYLHKTGLLQVSRGSGKKLPSPLLSIVKQAEKDSDMEVQIVPVSVFWGRNPGKHDGERSFFELLFADSERAGIIKKCLIVLVHGRGAYINIGKPISLREQVDSGVSAEQVAKKLRRVLRVHYISQRNAALGPSLPDRSSVVSSLMATKTIKDAIIEDSKKRNVAIQKSRAKAHSYLTEIAADTNHRVIRAMDMALGWVWNRIFEGVEIQNASRMRELSKTHEIVLLPSHRSHMDYLLLAWSTYYQGMAVPHTAAGVNLNFWPVGPILRKAGAFYIRRSFGGNRLYGDCFNEYVHYLLTKGHTLKFYLEGGRSRSGRLLPPKTGMLSMVLQSYYRSSDKPIAIFPVYLGYDKVMEVGTYLKELRGTKKKSESFGQFLQLRKIFRMKFGKAYIGFGKPILLTDFLNKNQENWQQGALHKDSRPDWHIPLVNKLADTTLRGINSAAIVNPISLFALVMLSTPSKALSEFELIYLLDTFISLIKDHPYSPDIKVAEGDGSCFLKKAIELTGASRFPYPGGDVIFLNEAEAIIMTYYRNNIVHLLVVPSLIASFMQHNDEILEEDLVQGAIFVYPFLQSEYYLKWDSTECRQVICEVIENLIEKGLLIRNNDMIARPSVSKRQFGALKILGRAISTTLERYSISTVLLSNYVGKGFIDRSDFEFECQQMAQRLSILNGSKDPEFFDPKLFKVYLDMLKKFDYIEQNDDLQMRVNESIRVVSKKTLNLLSTDVRQSITRTENEKAD